MTFLKGNTHLYAFLLEYSLSKEINLTDLQSHLIKSSSSWGFQEASRRPKGMDDKKVYFTLIFPHSNKLKQGAIHLGV